MNITMKWLLLRRSSHLFYKVLMPLQGPYAAFKSLGVDSLCELNAAEK